MQKRTHSPTLAAVHFYVHERRIAGFDNAVVYTVQCTLPPPPAAVNVCRAGLARLAKHGHQGCLMAKHKTAQALWKILIQSEQFCSIYVLQGGFLGPRGPLREPLSVPSTRGIFNLVIFKGCRRQRHRHKGTATEGTAYKDPSDKF